MIINHTFDDLIRSIQNYCKQIKKFKINKQEIVNDNSGVYQSFNDVM